MSVPNDPNGSSGAGLPREPIDRLVRPLAQFLHIEAASGALLLACAALALGLANSPWSESYLGLWQTPIGFRWGGFEMFHSLRHWINDGLMVVFFFVIGLEVKREFVLGELRDPKRAVLPLAAALGGMIVPAGIYLTLQFGEVGARGWGIPMATDIAFVVGCMAVLGRRIPHGLRVMLLSLAIADDVGAILVIAIGYTETIHATWLLLGFAGLGVTIGLARLGVRSIGVYVVVGVLVWLAFHESGVHATVAGVLLGLMTPAQPWVSDTRLERTTERVRRYLGGESWDISSRRRALLDLEVSAREALSPLERVERNLHPWSGFAIMPVFALANAGVPIVASSFADPVAQATFAGLFIGKPAGILLVAWLAVRLGLARLPEGVTWAVLTGGGFLAGIGFTMALFIASLALEGSALDAAKIGTLGASAIAGITGMGILLFVLPRVPSDPLGPQGIDSPSNREPRPAEVP